MKTVVLASATKSHPEAKVGVSFASEDGRIIVLGINPAGLFANTELRPGLEIVTINGSRVQGMTANEVKALLASLNGEVVIQAQPIKQSFVLTSPRTNGYSSHFQIPALPTLFKSKQVPEEEWREFVSQYQNELLPHVETLSSLERVFNKLMEGFVGQQMVRGYVGFGSESMQEKKAHTLVHHTAIEHSNLSMVATNLLMEANATFNSYGIWAKLVFEERSVPKIPGVDGIRLCTMVPTGIEFVAPASVI
jgi:hypothetical protein